ncbi:VOC family protein [Ruania zhangjianzhongii]|uniref:VOC family protein n=1 Tax=Ruania zhangjianzhongii TaxID=2603206 RepID=UPI0011CBAF90|nr:VOC family protein [Ruania zhangjianzhongii]
MAHGDITHIDIPVGDLDRATRFYHELFGWQISEIPGFEGYPMWRAPNQISGGGLAPRGEGFTQPRSYVEVDSIEDTLAKVTALGGEVVMGRSPISDTSGFAVFTDADGNTIGLYEGVTES